MADLCTKTLIKKKNIGYFMSWIDSHICLIALNLRKCSHAPGYVYPFVVDQCIYLKISGSKFIILVLYVYFFNLQTSFSLPFSSNPSGCFIYTSSTKLPFKNTRSNLLEVYLIQLIFEYFLSLCISRSGGIVN